MYNIVLFNCQALRRVFTKVIIGLHKEDYLTNEIDNFNVPINI